MADAPNGPIFGLAPLDRELAPKLPSGWLGLLGGSTDTETSLLAKQFAAHATREGPAIFYTTHEPTEEIQVAFDGLGRASDTVRIVNLSEEYFQSVLSRRLEVSRIRERGIQLADLKPSDAPPTVRLPYNLTNRFLSDLAGLDRPFRLVLDSLDFLIEVLDLPEVMTIARQVRHRAQAFASPALLVLHGETHERRVSGLLEGLADVVFELSAEPEGSDGDHRLKVRKVRNHPEVRRTTRLKVTSKGFAPAKDDAS